MRVFLCEDSESFFKGIKPEEILKKKDAQNKIKDTINTLLKFNVWIEAAIEVNSEGIMIVDTQFVNYWFWYLIDIIDLINKKVTLIKI